MTSTGGLPARAPSPESVASAMATTPSARFLPSAESFIASSTAAASSGGSWI